MLTSTASAAASSCGFSVLVCPSAEHRSASCSAAALPPPCPSPASYTRGKSQSQALQVFPAQPCWIAAGSASDTQQQRQQGEMLNRPVMAASSTPSCCSARLPAFALTAH